MKIEKFVLYAFLFSLLTYQVFPQNNGPITLTPLDKPAGEFGHLGFKIAVPWMDGSVEIRYPETLDSEDGMHFIDHDRSDMPPISRVKEFPDWNINESTGEISYSYTTGEGVEFGGIVNTIGEEVHMEFFVKNHTDKPIKRISPQICLALDQSNDFSQLRVTSDVFFLAKGKWISIDKTTPTPADKGRDPLLVIAKEGFTNIEAVGKTKIENPGSDIGTWWLLNETSDEDIIYRESKDKKHLIAVSWPGDASFLIYNSLNPCIHAGPSIQFSIDPNRERHWYGTVYLMDNDSQKLFEKYKSSTRYN